MADASGNGAARDPAPDPVALAEDRAHQLVGNISTHALDQLREGRDRLDDLMRGIDARAKALHGGIVELAQFSAEAIAAKVIIADALMQLTERIRPRVPPTITQQQSS